MIWLGGGSTAVLCAMNAKCSGRPTETVRPLSICPHYLYLVWNRPWTRVLIAQLPGLIGYPCQTVVFEIIGIFRRFVCPTYGDPGWWLGSLEVETTPKFPTILIQLLQSFPPSISTTYEQVKPALRMGTMSGTRASRAL